MAITTNSSINVNPFTPLRNAAFSNRLNRSRLPKPFTTSSLSQRASFPRRTAATGKLRTFTRKQLAAVGTKQKTLSLEGRGFLPARILQQPNPRGIVRSAHRQVFWLSDHPHHRAFPLRTSRAVADSGIRHRSQRRDRDGITPSSLFSPYRRRQANQIVFSLYHTPSGPVNITVDSFPASAYNQPLDSTANMPIQDRAGVAESADAQVSKTCGLKVMRVRVPPPAPTSRHAYPPTKKSREKSFSRGILNSEHCRPRAYFLPHRLRIGTTTAIPSPSSNNVEGSGITYSAS